MSYLVFARKWRPRTFEEVRAQDHVTVTLRNAISSDRIGHAYLFAGPRGVGKTTTARILAKALNCEKGPTPTPCLECPSCTRIASGSDLDVLEIDGASNRGIDEIRDLREKARYSPASGRWKIYIIDEVHMLTREAFNALLKILEEPPPSVLFVFATTEPRKVPATIVSRCQRFDFRRIPASVMTDYLSREAAGEGIEVDPDALSMIARASGGSLRDALSIMDQLVSFSGGRVTAESASGLLRIVQTDMLESLALSILAGDAAGALDTVSGAMDLGYSVEEVCDSFVEYLRNLMLSASGGEAGLAELTGEERAALAAVAARTSDLVVLDVLRIISSAAFEARSSSLPRVVLESAVLAACRLQSAVNLEDVPPGTAAPAVRRRVYGPPPAASADVPQAGRRAEPASAPAEPAPVAEDAREPDPAAGSPAEPQAGPSEAPAEGAADGEAQEHERTRSILDLFDAIPYDTDRRKR